MKTKTKYNSHIIGTLIIVVFVIMVVLYGPVLNDQFRVVQRTQVQVSVQPQIANLTLEGSEMVSKRIRVSFSEPAYLTNVNLETPLNIDELLDLMHNSTIKTNEHFVYIIMNNSRLNFTQGEYEGVIRIYYSIDQNNDSMSITLPMNIVIAE